MPQPIFTIGHSRHAADELVTLLDGHGINAVADVRSHPYSRIAPHFRKKPLEAMLVERGIAYVFLGRELGARRDEPEVYDGALARYELIAETASFADGLSRIEKGAERFRLALLCAEKDPLTCHRAILVARHLAARGLVLSHIHADGSIESTAELEERLLAATGLGEGDLFRDRQETLALAYRRHGERIGYRRDGSG